MSIELTRTSKKNVGESDVDQEFMVNEGKLVFTEFTQSPKYFLGFIVLTKLLLVNTESLFESVFTE